MNIKMIYPSVEGDVVEVITLEDAIEEQHRLGMLNGWCYNNDDEALYNLLADPTVTKTEEPVGKTITPYKERV